MPPQVNDVIRVVVNMRDDSGDIQNVYHVSVETAGPGLDDDIMLLVLAGTLSTAYNAVSEHFHESLVFDTIQAYNLTQDTYVGEQDLVVPTVPTAGPDSPPQLAPLVLFNTDVLRSQGRKFLPPMKSDLIQNDGTLQAPTLADIGTFAAALLGTITNPDVEFSFGNYNVPLGRFAQWLSAVAPDFFATQRRRYFGRGS